MQHRRFFIPWVQIFEPGDVFLCDFRASLAFSPPQLQIMTLERDTDGLSAHRRRQLPPYCGFGGDYWEMLKWQRVQREARIPGAVYVLERRRFSV
jgi:hypothetical protein